MNEQDVNRLNTWHFILARPSQIILTPRKREKTTGGGWKYEELPPRQPQTLRIIELGMNTTPPILTLTDGKQREAEFWLLGPWDAQIEIDDIWTATDGRVWQVGDIIRDNGYETRALVTERGK
ncbi:head-to-tail stopper [Microbacterium phage MortySmith]|nr:hypothetical protein SEA_AESIR_20 [Microbacterium phage Aesir]WNM69096.1 head-to-tail stopper [Microbacterium phage Erudite]